MSERIIWTDRSGALVDGGEPDTTRYIRCDVYEIMAELAYDLMMNRPVGDDVQAKAAAACRKANDA